MHLSQEKVLMTFSKKSMQRNTGLNIPDIYVETASLLKIRHLSKNRLIYDQQNN